MGEKRGGAVPFSQTAAAGTTSNTMWPGQGLLPYQVALSSFPPFAHNRHGPRTGEGLHPLFWEGLGPHHI